MASKTIRPSFDFDASDGGGINKENYLKEEIIKNYINIPKTGKGHKEVYVPSSNPQQSLPASSQSLIVPATQSDLETITSQYEGEIKNPKERFSNLKVYKKGNPQKNSWIYRAVDSVNRQQVAIKELTGSFDPEDMQGTRDVQKELESLITAYSMLEHPGLVQVKGYYWEDNGKGIMVPHVVMELVDGEPLSDRIARGYSPNQDDLLLTLFGVGSVVENMHTSRSQPVHHRDIKPANIMIVNGNSPWPYKVVDLTESKVGDATMSGSVLGSLGYRPPEQQWGEVNATTDWYGLFKTLEHCIMLGNFGRKDLSRETAPNVPERLIGVIRKGTSLEVEHRYKSLIDIARALGYTTDRVPQTRQELEAILGHKSLVPKIESPKPVSVPEETQAREADKTDLDMKRRKYTFTDKPDTNGNLILTLYDPNDTTVPFGRIPFKPGNSPYEALKNLRGVIDELKEGQFNDFIRWAINFEEGNPEPENYTSPKTDFDSATNEFTVAYTNHLTTNVHPILQEVLDGVARDDGIKEWKTLEGMLRERGSSLGKTILNEMKNMALIYDDLEPGRLGNFPIEDSILLFKRVIESYRTAKQTHNQRRQQVLDVFGAKEEESYIMRGFIGGATVGAAGLAIKYGLAPPLIESVPSSILWPVLFGSAFLGAVGGRMITKYIAKRKLAKKAHEVDSWIHQARVSQGLEEKVESVELTEKEKFEIHDIAFLKSSLGGLITTLGMGCFLLTDLPVNTNYLISLGLGGLTIASGFFDYKIKVNRALKKKRLALGLSADGLAFSETIQINDYGNSNLRKILTEFGLKERWLFKRKFVGDNVKVKYEYYHLSSSERQSFSSYSHTDVTIRAASKEKMEQIIESLKPLALPSSQPEIPKLTKDDAKPNIEEIIMQTRDRRGGGGSGG